MLTSFWILVWLGYRGVDGMKFETKEACERYGFERIQAFKRLEDIPQKIECIEITK